ncbi:MAG: iron-containing alcohol dehydrogenase [Alphaproteobacteria bacterium]|nr:iron-containing alcohol dehydrogenase [Alphaproteobacteria bacterium]
MKTLLPVPEIAIGAGRIDGIGADVAGLPGKPRRVLLVIDPALRGAGVTDRVLRSLDAAGIAAALFEDLRGEPTAALVDAAAALARQGAGAVIGVGGGSALDVAKLAAALAPAPIGAEHVQFCANPLPPAPLPALCVPTTAGTGSETTCVAVFLNTAGKKAWAWGPEIRAAKVILDPTLTTSLPPALTAATGIDALTHAVEACTNLNRFAANDAYCHQAIRLVARHLPTAVRAPGDLAAREGMLLAACFAGIGINNAGTAIGHTIAHALGSLGRVHHGRAAGLGMRAALPWNVAVNAEAYAAVAQALGGPAEAAALPGLVDRLVRAVGVKVALADELPGVTPARLAAEMALPENAAMRKSNARPSSDADLLALARAVLEAA